MGIFIEWLKKKMDGGVGIAVGGMPAPAPAPSGGDSLMPTPTPGGHCDHPHHNHVVGVLGLPWYGGTSKKKKECKNGKTKEGKCRKKKK